jgi:hypothetical protein
MVTHARFLSWINLESMWAPRCNCWRIIFVTYIWESQVAYGENIKKSRLVPRPHSTLSSEWRNNWRSECTVYQDGWLAQLAWPEG